MTAIDSMPRLCLIGQGQPSTNPRMVRDANALVAAGFDVRVVTSRFSPSWVSYDDDLARQGGWAYRYVDFVSSRQARALWHSVRLRRRGAALLSKWYLGSPIAELACQYSTPELAALGAKQRARLYIGYAHHSFAAAAWAARLAGGRYGCDAQDLLADTTDDQARVMRALEQRYLPGSVFVATMSDAAATRLERTNGLRSRPVVLHNTPAIQERAGVEPPWRRPASDCLSLYWFGLTLGPHSRAEQVIRVMPHLTRPVRLVLRGRPIPAYTQYLRRLASDLGVAERLHILPPAAPWEMVVRAAEHDIGLGTQPGLDLFHQMAIGNKVFTSMMAGLALGMTNTVAHRMLLDQAPGCGFVFDDNDTLSLYIELSMILKYPDYLAEMQRRSWSLAERRFNWDEEARLLVSNISQVLATGI